MQDKEILNYIRRNLIISEGLSRTIPDSEHEQEIHINRALEALSKINIKIENQNDFSILSLQKKRNFIWKLIKRNKLELILEIITKAKYLFLVLILALTTNYIIKFFKPHEIWSIDFYSNTSLSGLPIFSTEAKSIDFDWSDQAPSPKMNGGEFSARLKSCLILDQNQALTFRLGSDDGSRLIIDGNKIFENWRIQGFKESAQEIRLNTGAHLIEIEYFQSGGAAALRFDIKDKDSSVEKYLKSTSGTFDSCKK